jgi:hypothetical protein
MVGNGCSRILLSSARQRKSCARARGATCGRPASCRFACEQTPNAWRVSWTALPVPPRVWMRRGWGGAWGKALLCMMLRGRNVCGSCVALACAVTAASCGTPRPNNTRRNRNEKLGGEALVWVCGGTVGGVWFLHFRRAFGAAGGW